MRLNTLEPLWPCLDREEPEITMDEPLQTAEDPGTD